MKILLEDIISKRYTSSKQRKLARCCRAARYRHAHCTYISARKKKQERKMPASAKASKMKSPKIGTIERARKTTDLTSKEVNEHLDCIHTIELESLEIIYCIYNNVEGRNIKNKIKVSQVNNNGKRDRASRQCVRTQPVSYTHLTLPTIYSV